MLTQVMLPRKPYEKPALRQVGAMSAVTRKSGPYMPDNNKWPSAKNPKNLNF